MNFKRVTGALNNAMNKIFPFLPTEDDLKYYRIKKAMYPYMKIESDDYDINEKISLLMKSDIKQIFILGVD